MISESEFKEEVLSFFQRIPQLLEGIEDPFERERTFLAASYDSNLGALNYPVEDGGRGLGQRFIDIFRQELWNQNSFSVGNGLGIGIDMCLPTIRDHGSEEIRKRFLKPGLRGEEIWCQLYSEPGAGSDLAGLATRAELDGDEWVVSGQKVWTSGASVADLGILLARTNWDVPKHQGISMLVLPMNQDGVEVRPLKQMTGTASFNEVFMDNAKIPASWVVGTQGNGWRMAVALLSHERSSLGSGGGRQPLSTTDLIDLAQQSKAHTDPLTRQLLADLFSGSEIIKWLSLRTGMHPSIGKLWRTKQGQAASHVATKLAFPGGAAWEGEQLGSSETNRWAYGICDAPAHSLGGGTDEIQKNTLGEKVLGLPREPSVDIDIPFSEVKKN